MIESNDTTTQDNTHDTSESIPLGVGKALVTITILRIKGGQISLGIDAPPSIGIFREEIYRKRDQQNDSSPQNHYTDEDYSDDSQEEDTYY